jgi:CubicO group peptidase (beta-lactamase class C family)
MNLNKRLTLAQLSGAGIAALLPNFALANDYGRSRGFPTGWGPPGQHPNPWGHADYIVGNFSGGIEKLFSHRLVKAPEKPSVLKSKPIPMKWGLFSTFQEYQKKFGKPAVLVGRSNTIAYEHYEFDRTQDMRFYSKSMAKSVLSLITGLAFEQGVLDNLDDPIEKYDSRLKNKALGIVTIRQALNMSSGADICHWLCGERNNFDRWDLHAFLGHPRSRGKNTDQDATAINWGHGFKNRPGTAFNYSEIDPHLISMAIRASTKTSIADFAEKALWAPIGAESDAVWLTDSKGVEDVGASFSATLRDWGRLALLVAQQGNVSGRQVIKQAWFDQCRTFLPSEGYLRKGRISGYDGGYKFFFHHPKDDGEWLRLGGDLGQTIYIDFKSGTVLVILSASNEGGGEYRRLFETSIAATGSI